MKTFKEKCNHIIGEKELNTNWEYTGATLTSRCKKCGMFGHRIWDEQGMTSYINPTEY